MTVASKLRWQGCDGDSSCPTYVYGKCDSLNSSEARPDSGASCRTVRRDHRYIGALA